MKKAGSIRDSSPSPPKNKKSLKNPFAQSPHAFLLHPSQKRKKKQKKRRRRPPSFWVGEEGSVSFSNR